MNSISSRKPAHVAKRVICALLAVGFIVALVCEIVAAFRSGQVPSADRWVGTAAGMGVAYLFGLYAIKGRG